MKKENVYVEVRTEKQAKKLKKVLEMFGERLYSKDSIPAALDNNWVINYNKVDLEWENSSQRNKTEVTIKQLRNILAINHLKEGDVVVVKGNDTGIKRVGVINSFEVCSADEITILSDNFTDLDQKEPKDDSLGFAGNFIRYATEDEKALLKPNELTADDYKDLTWYKSPQTGNIFFLDKSKRENYGFSKYGYRYELEWFSNFQANGFHNKGEWIEAEACDVKEKLLKEAEKRNITKGSIIDANGVRADIVNGFPVLSANMKILFYAGLCLFLNGKWAEDVKV